MASKRRDEEGNAKHTCVEPIIRFTEEQLLIQKLTIIKYKIEKKYFTEKELNAMLNWCTIKAEL